MWGSLASTAQTTRALRKHVRSGTRPRVKEMLFIYRGACVGFSVPVMTVIKS